MRRRQLDGRHTLALLALVCLGVLGLGGAAAAAPDSKGTDYWLMFPQNFSSPTLSLFVTSDVNTTGTVAIPGLGVTTPFTVAAGTVTTVPIPGTAEAQLLDTVQNLGIHVTAQAEVTVYGLSQAQFTTDAYLGLPTDVLGTDHVVLAYRNGGPVPGSQFGVVGTQAATTVTITPSQTTGAHPAGVPYTVTLDAGQTYQLRNTAGAGDLTGTTVTSDKPIAVFGSHYCANVPPSAGFCDHVVEQLPPTSTWGERFVTMPLATRLNGDTFRFLASTDDTTVSVNGTSVATLDRGQVHEQVVVGAATIDASNPILVAQYSNGTEFDGVTSDPFMMLVPPFEQFLAEYTITTPAVVFNTNFVNVVVPTSAVASMTLDGAPIPPASFSAIGSSGFSGAQLAVSVGSHRLAGSLPFGVFAYGFADFDSYGYPGGASFSPVAVVANVALAPKTATNLINTQHCVTATVTDTNGGPLESIRVDFAASGANTVSGFAFTNASGQAQFCYSGANAGNDTITASVGSVSDTAAKTWIEPARAATLTLTPEQAENVVGTQHCVTATVRDQRNDLFPGAPVAFAVTGVHTVSGSATTGANGEAQFCYTGGSVGDDTITATTGSAITDTATKKWIPEPARAATLTLTPEQAENVVGTQHCVTATVRDQRNDLFPGAAVAFAVTGAHTASGSATTGANGEAQFCYTGTAAGDDTITASAGQGVSDTATKKWVAPATPKRVFVVLDDDARAKGKPVWAAGVGEKLVLEGGQTGDEGWFAPTCVPRKWLGGSSNECLEGAERDRALDNIAGLNGGSAVPRGSRLDKVPAVMPLRALGLGSLVGKDVCALPFGSDVGVNYDSTAFPFTSASLQSRGRGPAAFHVDAVTAARGSSSSLPLVSVTVLDPATCGDWLLLNAPVPRSSSEPEDTNPEAPAGVGPKGYLQLKTWPARELFF